MLLFETPLRSSQELKLRSTHCACGLGGRWNVEHGGREQGAPVGPSCHDLPDLRRKEILPLPNLPASTEGFVGGNKVEHHIALRRGQAILLLDKEL